jgi:hypothetical protein
MPAHKQKVFKTAHVYDLILDHLKLDHVLPELVQGGFVSEEEETMIRNETTSFNSLSTLIYVLLKKDESGFDAFVGSLRNHPTDYYRGIVNAIDEVEKRRRSSTPSTTLAPLTLSSPLLAPSSPSPLPSPRNLSNSLSSLSLSFPSSPISDFVPQTGSQTGSPRGSFS